MIMDRYRCSCGASGDPGEMEEHQYSMLTSPDDHQNHTLTAGMESERVSRLRSDQAAARETAEGIAAQLGVTVDELKHTFGNLR